MAELRGLFDPAGCAVMGASADPAKAGYQIVANMLQAGCEQVYPVNPRGQEVLGLKTQNSLSQIDDPVQMVVSAVPAHYTQALIDDLRMRQRHRGDVRFLVVVAAGYAETREEDGLQRQQALLQACSSLDIRVLGPNCVGVVDNRSGIDTTFISEVSRQEGGISFVSQSGAMGAWLMQDWASRRPPVGLSKFTSVGNMADIDLVEILDHLREDDSTSVVGMYLEGYPQGRSLAESLHRLARRKPVVVLKVGRTDRGARAAQSHTGSMAGQDRIYDGMLKQVGARRASSVEELSDTLQAFDRLQLPEGNRVFLITQAGGPGIYCTDELEKNTSLCLAEVRERTKDKLQRALPPFASICNPEGHADITAAASAAQHARALRVVLEDEGVDAAVLITVPVLFMPAREVARELIQLTESCTAPGKPVLAVLLSGKPVQQGIRMLETNGILTFPTPDRAVRALHHMAEYRKWLRKGEDQHAGG